MLLLRTRSCISSIRGVSEHCSLCACVWMWCITCTYCDGGMFLFLQSDQQLDCALDLMRRLPPQQIEKNLSDLIDLVSIECSDQVMAVLGVMKIWYVRTSSEASRRCGDLFLSLSFGKVEEYSNCPSNVRNLHVYFGQANRYYCVCTDTLSDEGSLAAFLMKSLPVWRMLFSKSNLEQFIQGWWVPLHVSPDKLPACL